MGEAMYCAESTRRTREFSSPPRGQPAFEDPIPKAKGIFMSTANKAKNKIQAAKGHLDDAAGKATDDKSRQAKGKREKASGNLKQAGEKVKDAIRS
jgi:uncharacterized protein YjbJ (UPF0337 family)